MSRIVDPALSIPQLFGMLKHSFPESELNEVQRILMDRETKMKAEIEKLEKDYVSAKKWADLLEMSQKVAEVDKLNLDEEIALLRRERDALKRQNVELITIENRMMKLEGNLAAIFNVEVEDLAAIANSVEESDDGNPADAMGGVNSDAARTSPALQSGGTLPRVELQVPGDRNLFHSSAKDNGASTSRTSRGSQPGGSHPRVEPQVPGDRNLVHSSTNIATRTSALRSGGCPPRVEPQVPDLTGICDADDETNLTAKRKRKRGTYISSDEEDENIPIHGKEIQDPKSTHDRITPHNGAPAKRSTICDDSQTHDSDSEDDSPCSDDHMNNLVATLARK